MKHAQIVAAVAVLFAIAIFAYSRAGGADVQPVQPNGPRWEYGELQYMTYREGAERQNFREKSRWVTNTSTTEGTKMGDLLLKLGGAPKDTDDIWTYNFLGAQGWEFVSKEVVKDEGNQIHETTIFKRPIR